jgi:hypothetical protein
MFVMQASQVSGSIIREENVRVSRLKSPNGRFVMKLNEENGVVSICEQPNHVVITEFGEPSTLTGRHAACALFVQGDMRLVIYNRNGTPTFASKTYNGGPAPASISLSNDGICRLKDTQGNTLWSTGDILLSHIAKEPEFFAWISALEAKGLKVLDLDGCHSLKGFEEGFLQVIGLKKLSLKGYRLEALPNVILMLQQLECLVLGDCTELEALPENISMLKSLTVLDLKGCHSLKALPEGIAQLQHLERLSLEGCIGMKVLPLGCLEMQTCKCTVFLKDCGFAKEYGWNIEKATLEEFRNLIRLSTTMQSLLGDRDARRETLNSVAVVAVLLATAAFVAFAQTPSVANAFSNYDKGAEAANTGIEPTVVDQRKWLRIFFIADQIAFFTSMTVVVLYLVSSLPKFTDSDKMVAAASVWIGYFVFSLLLAAAVAAGMVAFVAAGYAVYPKEFRSSDLRPAWMAGLLLMLAPVITWIDHLFMLWPGGPAIRRCFKMRLYYLVARRQQKIQVPLQGVEETAYELLQEVKHLKAGNGGHALTTKAQLAGNKHS